MRKLKLMNTLKGSTKSSSNRAVSRVPSVFGINMGRTFKLKLFNFSQEEISLDTFVKFPLSLLRLVFVSMKSLPVGASKREKLRHKAKYVYNRFQFACYLWTIFSKIILMVQSESFLMASQLFLDVISFILNEMKVIHFVLHKEKIWSIFQDVKSLRNNEEGFSNHSYDLRKYLSGYHKLLFAYAFPSFSILIMNVLPIIPYILFGKMIFLIVYWYPFDPYEPAIFPFAYLWVNYALYSVVLTLMAADSMFFALINMISMEFDILRTDLMNILQVSENTRKDKLQKLVDRHQSLLDICEKFQGVYSATSLLSFVISSLVMCFVAFQISSGQNDFLSLMFYLNYLLIMGAQVLLLCFFGQKLIDSSENIAEGAYNCGWENSSDEDFKKQLILIILRSQRAKKLSAMGFADISLETYTRILATTGSYFSLLSGIQKA